MQSVTLKVVQGPDAGRSFRIDVGSYRVIGRSFGAMGGTAMISQGERRRLDAEDQRKVQALLTKRGAELENKGARAEVSSFARQEDIDLSDDATSQTHAMVFVDEAGASFVDVASTNGSYVNGKRISEVTLRDGDLVRLGETRVEVVTDATPVS